MAKRKKGGKIKLASYGFERRQVVGYGKEQSRYHNENSHCKLRLSSGVIGPPRLPAVLWRISMARSIDSMISLLIVCN